jgi:hypothetical protein
MATGSPMGRGWPTAMNHRGCDMKAVDRAKGYWADETRWHLNRAGAFLDHARVDDRFSGWSHNAAAEVREARATWRLHRKEEK